LIRRKKENTNIEEEEKEDNKSVNNRTEDYYEYHHNQQLEKSNNCRDYSILNLSTTTAATKVTTGTMPSKQANDVLAVEELVHEIKENLRLKARPSHNHGRSRPSPYHIPCRSWNDQNMGCGNHCSNSNNSNHSHHLHHHHHHHSEKTNKKEEDIDDPYELLQTLLKSKNLVKEAVRRLQLNISPKQRFYESDEESSSPMFTVCQLEL